MAAASSSAVAHWLPTVPLTASGRPIFLPGEVERYLLPSVDLDTEENSSLPSLLSGLLVLTSHRLVWIYNTSSSAHAIPLAAVVHAYPPKKSIRHLFATPRVRLQISLGGRSELVTFVLRGKTDPDVFHGKLVEVMRERAWEREEEKEDRSDARREAEVRVRMPVVGVSGILRKEQEMWENTDKSLQDAFQDLNALMGKAKEMVQLAEKMRLKLLSSLTAQTNSNDEEMGSKQDMQDWLLSVGIASPVTKESAGALYHQQLSRQVFSRITSLAQKPDALRKGVSPSDAAFTLGIAPALAKEHLLTAESKGLLCRDVSADGFRFYINLFKEIDPDNIYSCKTPGLFHAWISATTVSG
ncbi:vacuolar protein sorting-associated protein 36 isoform X2 [Typha latifolia]|uniref:vacuolar protein sorting-associated protein 36 isoform X2 n=1 Tax=Typha latifolia TaxID=4733 RepID=UPI003C2E2918